jgi:hypothetical protein
MVALGYVSQHGRGTVMIARHIIESESDATIAQRVQAACNVAAVLILCLCLAAFLLLAN